MNRSIASFFTCALYGLLVWVTSPITIGSDTIQFNDGMIVAGIDFNHNDGSTGRRYLMENIASGMGVIDYDGDGDLDLYFLNGAYVDPKSKSAPSNALFQNNGNGQFKDVTLSSGLGDIGYGMGCAVADYDNDGDQDIYITNAGPNRLYQNNGDGTFKDVSDITGVGDSAFGAGCAFFDYDRDGYLDLYVSNYLQFDAGKYEPCLRANIPVYCDPRTYPSVKDRLYRNKGDGTFEDVTDASGVGSVSSYGMGVVCSDFDGDGWSDIFIGNDVEGNFLFHNQGDGSFKEIGLLSGVAYDEFGDEQGTMGADVADYDGDGRLDLMVTTYQNQTNTLYRNLGNMFFQDVTVSSGFGIDSISLVTWGCNFADFDRNGEPEVFIAAGHLQDTVEKFDGSSTYPQKNMILQKQGRRFKNITATTGEAMQFKASSRGSVTTDLDNDGDLDVVVLNARSKPSILINDTKTTNHWLSLKLIGVKSNRSAIGAHVSITAGGKKRVAEVRSGSGYQSANDLRLYFGLGTHAIIDELEISWPSGINQQFDEIDIDRFISITEGNSELGSYPVQ